MVNLIDSEHCTGCAACANVCPVGSISMVEDEAGFFRPKIAAESCKQCNKCMNVCPVLNLVPPPRTRCRNVMLFGQKIA